MTPGEIDELRLALRMEVREVGMRAWCDGNGVPERTVAEVMHGEWNPTPAITSALGYELRLVRKDAT